MKKILLLIFVLFFSLNVYAAEFWASSKSNKYHYPTCKWAQKINPKNLIVFKSPEDAIKSGYIPCKVCKPPVASKSK
ncbi:MAG: Ada metal-binding domain-containing protein [Nitrospirota bacterium]